jgi:dTDP-4-dehydrorhamnose reductase
VKRLLVTGASGNLGYPLSARASSLVETTSTYYHNQRVGGGHAVRLDLRDAQAVMALVERTKPDVIIHAAVSDRSSDMFRTNQLAAQTIGRAAESVNARLIALSTDLIFDGIHPPYDEEAPPSPIGPYGRVKAANEHLFTEAHHNCLVVRTSLIYDLAPDNNQVRWLKGIIETHQKVPLFVDEIRQPIWAWNLADILLELADSVTTGILNVAGPQRLSRWEFGCALLKALGYEPDQAVQPVLAAEIAPQRPRDCTLDLAKAQSILHTPLVSISKALAANPSWPPHLDDYQAMI